METQELEEILIFYNTSSMNIFHTFVSQVIEDQLTCRKNRYVTGLSVSHVTLVRNTIGGYPISPISRLFTI